MSVWLIEAVYDYEGNSLIAIVKSKKEVWSKVLAYLGESDDISKAIEHRETKGSISFDVKWEYQDIVSINCSGIRAMKITVGKLQESMTPFYFDEDQKHPDSEW